MCCAKSAMVSSTGFPAITNKIILRGFLMELTKAAASACPSKGNSPSSFALFTVTSILSEERLETETRNPFEAMFRAKFWPITAKPYKPTSQLFES